MASLKYGGLFDDEPAAAVPSSKGKGSAYSSLFGDDPRNPKKQVKKYPGLFDDDTGAADVANCTVPAASRKAAVPAKDLFVDDGDMTVSAAAMIASARGRSQIPPSPTANTKPSQLIPVDDPAAIEDDESMFELKYYEERARRMRLETRIAELENTVLALMAQLEVKSGGSALAAVTPIAEELEAVGAKLGVADHNEEALAATGDADPHATALILEDGRQRRQAEQERRQRQQRRSASTSARRLHGRTVVAGSGEGPVGTAALEAMPTETISSILSWSSDDDVPEPAAFKSCASLGNGNNVDAAIPSVEETSAEGPSQFDTCGAADEATYRRRQKAYRGAMGARPTSRRLGANRLGSRQQQTGKGAGGATTSQHSDNAKRKSSLGGFEKWSDSEESTGSVHCKDQSSGHRDKRAESLHWDSEIEDAVNVEVTSAPQMNFSIVVTDEESADRRVVSWARGKDIVLMIRTFCDIYEDADSLPGAILKPEINCPADVRKAYLNIVKYCHPDKQSKLGGMKHIAPKLFSAVTDAYNDFRNQPIAANIPHDNKYNI